MWQAPSYLIIGNGRVATHMCHYFSYLDLTFAHWFRRQSVRPLSHLARSATHVLLLIADNAIEDFIHKNVCLTGKQLIHFSGCHVSEMAYGAHPLMTFNRELYHPTTYQTIPFILDQERLDFSDLLPGLPNPHFVIPQALKPYYHSLCVMANNFTTILWQKFFYELQTRWSIPHTVSLSFLRQTFENLHHNHTDALTGPLVRQDIETLEKNFLALDGDPFQAVFKAFTTAYKQQKSIEQEEPTYEYS